MVMTEAKGTPGVQFLVAHVIPIFRNLLEDSLPEVRAKCALVLPRLIQLTGPVFANLLFEDMFFAVLTEANPLVLEMALIQIELAISTLRHTTHEDIPCKHLLVTVKKSFVSRLVDVWQRILPSCAKQWRCFALYID